MAKNDDSLLNVTDAAAFLGVMPRTIRGWILKRRLPYVKVGRCVRIRRSELQKLIARGTVPAVSERAAS